MKKTKLASKIVSVMLAVMLGVSTPCYSVFADTINNSTETSTVSEVGENSDNGESFDADSTTPSSVVEPGESSGNEDQTGETSVEPSGSPSSDETSSVEPSGSPSAGEETGTLSPSVSPKASASPEASTTPEPTATPIPVSVDGFKEFFTKVEVGAGYENGQIVPFGENVGRDANVAVLLEYVIPKGQAVEANTEYPFTITAPLLVRGSINIEITATNGPLAGQAVGNVSFEQGDGVINAKISFTEEGVENGYGGIATGDVPGGFYFWAQINSEKIDNKGENKIDISINEKTKCETETLDFELPEGKTSLKLVKNATNVSFDDNTVTWTLDATPTVEGFEEENYVKGVKIVDDLSDKNIIIDDNFTVTAKYEGKEINGTLTVSDDKKSFTWVSEEGKYESGKAITFEYKTKFDPTSSDFKPSNNGKVTIKNSADATADSPEWQKNPETKVPEIVYTEYGPNSPKSSSDAKTDITVGSVSKTGKIVSSKSIEWTITAVNGMQQKNPYLLDTLPQYFELDEDKAIKVVYYDKDGNKISTVENFTDYENTPSGDKSICDTVKFNLDETAFKSVVTYYIKAKSDVDKSLIPNDITNKVKFYGPIGLIAEAKKTINTGEYYVTKSGTYNPYNHTIDWTITIKCNGENLGFLDVYDTFGNESCSQTRVPGSYKLYHDDEEQIKFGDPKEGLSKSCAFYQDSEYNLFTASIYDDSDLNGFHMNIIQDDGWDADGNRKTGAYGTYVLKYTTKLDDGDPYIWGSSSANSPTGYTISNSVQVKSNEIPYTATNKAEVKIISHMLQKNAVSYDFGTKKITWELQINRNCQELKNATITDTLPDANWKFDIDSVKLYDVNDKEVTDFNPETDITITGTEDGKIEEMTVKLPDSEANSLYSGEKFMYTLKYTTSVKNDDVLKSNETVYVKNKAVLKYDGGPSSGVETWTRQNVGNSILRKKGSNATFQKDGLLAWTIDVNLNRADMSDYNTIYDELANGLNYKSVKVNELYYKNNMLTEGEELTEGEDYTVSFNSATRVVAITFSDENAFKEKAYRIVLSTRVMESGKYSNTVYYAKSSSETSKWDADSEKEIDANYSGGWTNLPDGLGALTITKLNKLTLASLKGAEFKIDGSAYSDNNEEAKNVSVTATTGEDGTVSVILPAGTYDVTEIKAPDGYITSGETQKVTVAQKAETSVTFKNAPKQENKGVIFITKTIDAKDEATAKDLPKSDLADNIKFDIQYEEMGPAVSGSDDGPSYEWVTVKSIKLSEFTTEDASGCSWRYSYNAYPGRTYRVVETVGDEVVGWSFVKASSTIAGTTTDGDTSASFKLAKDTEVEVSFTNTYGKTYTAQINKQTEDKAALKGALLQIYDENEKLVEYWTSDGSAHTFTAVSGTYKLHEDKAPAGYDTADDITFTVTADGKVTIADKEVSAVTMTDKLTNRDVEISKKSVGGEELEGAKLTVTDKDGKVVDTWTSEKESHTITVPMGEYTLHEDAAPAGYDITNDITFVVDENGKVTVNGEEVTEVTMVDDLTQREVEISKKSVGGEELEGAKLTVTDKDGNVVDTWTSTKESHTIKVPMGEYTLHEDAAPAGFDITNDITFVVDENGKVTVNGEEVTEVTMVDDLTQREVEISKKSVGGEELEGAKLTVTDKDGNVVDTWTSEKESHTITVPMGEYTLHEDAAPAGYDVTNDITFVVDEYGNVTVNGEKVTAVTMVDELTIREIEISKKSVGGDELEGAKLTVTDKDGNVVDTWTSEKESHRITVPMGEYKLHEDAAPAGYDVTNDITFVVDENGKVTVNGEEVTEVTMVDDTTKWDVEISKVDATTSKEIEGAKLEIKDADGNVVASWTSGSDGKNSDGSLKTHVVSLPFGTYTLTEKTAPKGYEVAETITFTVGKDGKVEGGKVVMKDAKTPEVTPTPSATPNSNSGTPKTGDDSNIHLWVILFAVSACALTGTAVIKRRKQK